MIFDFDKTLHQVKKTGQQETPRILLKLHFIVDACLHSGALGVMRIWVEHFSRTRNVLLEIFHILFFF
jgi:hypothetical protein